MGVTRVDLMRLETTSAREFWISCSQFTSMFASLYYRELQEWKLQLEWYWMFRNWDIVKFMIIVVTRFRQCGYFI